MKRLHDVNRSQLEDTHRVTHSDNCTGLSRDDGCEGGMEEEIPGPSDEENEFVLNLYYRKLDMLEPDVIPLIDRSNPTGSILDKRCVVNKSFFNLSLDRTIQLLDRQCI